MVFGTSHFSVFIHSGSKSFLRMQPQKISNVKVLLLTWGICLAPSIFHCPTVNKETWDVLHGFLLFDANYISAPLLVVLVVMQLSKLTIVWLIEGFHFPRKCSGHKRGEVTPFNSYSNLATFRATQATATVDILGILKELLMSFTWLWIVIDTTHVHVIQNRNQLYSK